MKLKHTLFTLVVLLTTTTYLAAGPFKIGNYSCTGNPAICSAVNSQILAELQNIENQVNEQLPNVDSSRYALGMGNSLALSHRGLGVDYGSNISLFVVGGGAGLAFDPGDTSGGFKPEKIAGFGAAVSGMVGLNLGLFPIPQFGPIDLKKGVLFLNFAAFDIPNFAKEFSGDFSTFGLNIRYNLVERWSFLKGLAEWSGLDLVTGLNYSSMNLKVSLPIKQTFNTSLNSNTTMNGNYTAQAVTGPEVSIFTIPIEVVTGVRFLYLFRLYGGLGLDLNFGSSKVIAKLPGQLSATVTNTSLSQTANLTADTSLDLTGSATPDIFSLRALLGLQLDFAVFNMFIQSNISPTAGTLGLSMGARAFF